MVTGAHETITRSVMQWDGVVSAPHRFGGTEYRLGTREIGHLHGDYMLDIPFPKEVRDEVVSAGLAQPHHLLPETGWVSFYLVKAEDQQAAVDLLRRSYQVALAQLERRSQTAKEVGK
jgi:hypothetical protein